MPKVYFACAIRAGGDTSSYLALLTAIKEADFVIAEVTNPSLGVGYELGYAETLRKPILCVFNKDSERKLSAMVSGNPYNKVIEYTPDLIPLEVIKAYIES